jgi:cytochrome c-type protein NapB
MKKIILAGIAIVSLSVSAMAMEKNTNYNGCVGFHGANGEKAALGKSKIIKDMTKEELVKSLIGYKEGSYGGAMKGLMKGQVAKYSNEQLTELAGYISTFNK